MADEPRTQFALEEIVFLFEALERMEHPCVLMGGQSACYWARRYQTQEPVMQELAEVSPLLSKDVDFQGSREDVIAFARLLGQHAEVPDFRRAFGNLMAGKFSVDTPRGPLSVEVLRKVPGLAPSELERLSGREPFNDRLLRVLNPLGVLKAKAWNVVNISKEGRHDAEQLFALVPCLRAYLRGFLQEGQADQRVLRAGLYLVEQTLRFTELPAGRKTAEKCGVDWAQILPHNFIAASSRPELVRLREKRLPGWLAHIARYRRAVPASETHRKMLAILARHAEPLCVHSAIRNPCSAIR